MLGNPLWNSTKTSCLISQTRDSSTYRFTTRQLFQIRPPPPPMSLCVTMGSLMRLILIKVYLYLCSAERKADTDSMNFNTRTPFWSACCRNMPRWDAGLLQRGGAGLWVRHMEVLSSSHTISFCVFIMLIRGGLRRVSVESALGVAVILKSLQFIYTDMKSAFNDKHVS